MNTKAIRKKIREAVAHEASTGTLAGAFRQTAQLNGRRVKAGELKQAVEGIRSYVEHAVVLLEQLESAAEEAGISEDVGPILATAEQYFLAPLDFIPDHLGLGGLMDDAYLVHRLVQSVSDRHEEETDAPLLPLPTEMPQVNQRIRMCIGEPMATQLDMAVQASLGMPSFQQALGQLMRFRTTLPMGPDPIWGNASMDEIVNVRLGAIGVV